MSLLYLNVCILCYLNRNEICDPLRVSILKTMEMGRPIVSAAGASSATLQNWQHGKKVFIGG